LFLCGLATSFISDGWLLKTAPKKLLEVVPTGPFRYARLDDNDADTRRAGKALR
jgi:hypothetical protein